MKTLQKQQLVSLIENSKGRFVTVKFLKKDGSERILNGRLGVVSKLKGGTKTTGDNYITVYDVQAGGYRSVNKDTILEVHADKQKFVVG